MRNLNEVISYDLIASCFQGENNIYHLYGKDNKYYVMIEYINMDTDNPINLTNNFIGGTVELPKEEVEKTIVNLKNTSDKVVVYPTSNLVYQNLQSYLTKKMDFNK